MWRATGLSNGSCSWSLAAAKQAPKTTTQREENLNRLSPKRGQTISNFPCSLTRNITSHSMKNLACHSLLRWKMIILPILATSFMHFSLKGWENVLFELGSESDKHSVTRTVRSTAKALVRCIRLPSWSGYPQPAVFASKTIKSTFFPVLPLTTGSHLVIRAAMFSKRQLVHTSTIRRAYTWIGGVGAPFR